MQVCKRAVRNESAKERDYRINRTYKRMSSRLSEASINHSPKRKIYEISILPVPSHILFRRALSQRLRSDWQAAGKSTSWDIVPGIDEGYNMKQDGEGA